MQPVRPEKKSGITARWALLACAGALSLLAGTSPALHAQSTVAQRMEEVINAPDYKHAHWGILAVDMDSGATVYERESEKVFAPASTTKLFTVATALDVLGADYQFKTRVVRRGDVDDDGQLNGDLVLVAGGDLTMGGRTDSEGRIAFRDIDHTYANGNGGAELTDQDPMGGLNELAKQVAAAGIKRIKGEVIVDDRMFDRAEGTGSGPVKVSPIMINDNVVDVQITPSMAGMPALISTRPRTASIRIDALVDTVEPNKETRTSVTYATPGRIIVRGQIPEGRKPLIRVVEVEDPTAFARSLFIDALRKQGVASDASSLTGNRLELLPVRDSYKKENRVALLNSPPFSENARLILKVSHNLHASTLPLLIAAHQGKRTLADGFKAEREFLGKAGVDVDSISFSSGAGGGKGDFVTPQATVQLLRYMSTRPDFPSFEAALPLLGVDGTLASTVSMDSPARAKVRAKTGTLSWEDTLNERFIVLSKALAGYVTTAKNRRVAFAMFVNGTHIPSVSETTREGKILGKLCEILYEDEPGVPMSPSRRESQ